jgi:hypothetical protein
MHGGLGHDDTLRVSISVRRTGAPPAGQSLSASTFFCSVTLEDQEYLTGALAVSSLAGNPAPPSATPSAPLLFLVPRRTSSVAVRLFASSGQSMDTGSSRIVANGSFPLFELPANTETTLTLLLVGAEGGGDGWTLAVDCMKTCPSVRPSLGEILLGASAEDDREDLVLAGYMDSEDLYEGRMYLFYLNEHKWLRCLLAALVGTGAVSMIIFFRMLVGLMDEAATVDREEVERIAPLFWCPLAVCAGATVLFSLAAHLWLRTRGRRSVAEASVWRSQVTVDRCASVLLDALCLSWAVLDYLPDDATAFGGGAGMATLAPSQDLAPGPHTQPRGPWVLLALSVLVFKAVDLRSVRFWPERERPARLGHVACGFVLEAMLAILLFLKLSGGNTLTWFTVFSPVWLAFVILVLEALKDPTRGIIYLMYVSPFMVWAVVLCYHLHHRGVWRVATVVLPAFIVLGAVAFLSFLIATVSACLAVQEAKRIRDALQ